MPDIRQRLFRLLALDAVVYTWSIIGGPSQVENFIESRKKHIFDPGQNLDLKCAIIDLEELKPFGLWPVIEEAMQVSINLADLQKTSVEAIGNYLHSQVGKTAAETGRKGANDWWRDRLHELHKNLN